MQSKKFLQLDQAHGRPLWRYRTSNDVTTKVPGCKCKTKLMDFTIIYENMDGIRNIMQSKETRLQNWDLVILQLFEIMKLGKLWWETTRKILSLQVSVDLEYIIKSTNLEFTWWLTWLFQDIQPINKCSTWNERKNNLVNL